MSVVVRWATFGAAATRAMLRGPASESRSGRCYGALDTLRTLLDDSGFWLGAAVAAAVLGALGVARLATGRWWAGAGTAAAIGGLVGLTTTERVSEELVAALALLALGALLTQTRMVVLRVVAAAPGAVLLAYQVPEIVPRWVPFVVGVATVVGCALLPELDGDRPRLTGVCLAIAAAGVFFAVPDTEEARTIVGAMLVAGLLSIAPDVRRDAVGASAAIGLLMWTAGTGGYARPGAVVGGVACLGVLVLGWVVRWARPHDLVVLAVQAGLVLAVARGAGSRESATAAAVIVAAAYVLATLALVIGGRVWPQARGRARRASRSRRGPRPAPPAPPRRPRGDPSSRDP